MASKKPAKPSTTLTVTLSSDVKCPKCGNALIVRGDVVVPTCECISGEYKLPTVTLKKA